MSKYVGLFVWKLYRVYISLYVRLIIMRISMSTDGKMVKVGEYHAITDTLNLSSGEPIMWRGLGRL